jgi:hypothetical protein
VAAITWSKAKCSLQNLIRGRGVFCRSLMKSQLASPTFTPTYAALIAIINTKFPEIGELLLKRVISQVGMYGSLCLRLSAHFQQHWISLLSINNASQGQSHATQKHGSLFVSTNRAICRAWRDCAFLPFFVIAVLTVVPG